MIKFSERRAFVVSHRETWIEIPLNPLIFSVALSSLTERRGLKFLLTLFLKTQKVVSHRETWIEIFKPALAVFTALGRLSQRDVD